MRVVSLYGKVGFHKVFLQSPFLILDLCGLKLDLRFNARHEIEGMALG